jgi:2-polyprenyl-3-methyl-5-hydroxy-6-metoxy-1,4-benzoquinol methylase
MMNVSAPVEKDHLSLCTVCGGGQWSFVRLGNDLYQPEDEAGFKLYRCLSCGQVMQNPLPTAQQLSKAYSAEYAPYRPAWKEHGWPLWKVLRELTTWRRMRRLRRYGRGSRLLEVGCGAGDFLHAAHRAGWEVKAVEYSGALAEALRSELGFDVRTGDLTPGLWPSGSFDVVVMWSVLEHLSNPLEALVTACAYLKPGGVLFIQIPTLYGVEQGRQFAQYWALLDLPRHLSFFGNEDLSHLCERAGMKLTVFKTPLVETVWCYYASIGNYASRQRRPLRRIFGALSLMALTILSLPVMVLRARRGHGTEAFAVAVKSSAGSASTA